MVSKIAVIAIVGILAVPILLGYALNLEQVTETDYKTTDDSVNVTPLLQTGIEYNYANADAYQLNTNFIKRGLIPKMPTVPIFEKVSNNKTSYNLTQSIWPSKDLNLTFAEWTDKFAQVNVLYTSPGEQNERLVIFSDTLETVLFIDHLLYMYYDAATAKVQYIYYSGNDYTNAYNGSYSVTNTSYYMMIDKTSGTFDVVLTLGRSSATEYVDVSAGWVLTSTPYNFPPGHSYIGNNLKLPDYSNNIVLTFDLSSITDANYQFNITNFALQKTTIGTDITWKVKDISGENDFDETDIYYDPAASSNTYQLKIITEPNNGRLVSDQTWAFPIHYELRYVGQWPTLIGEANYYQNYKFDTEKYVIGGEGVLNYSEITINTLSEKTPKMRVDAALYRAFDYPVIKNKTYDPAAFKTNPATTINDPTQFGSSIEFGGNTYIVKNGNITMGTHQIPVKGLVLSSVPNPEGGYDNKIGNTVISTTAAPSAITFNGVWSASISTTAQEEYDVTKTEWKAGSFAWDGMDQNFLIVGLLTSLGAFIALGIYARRSRASIWPLMIVCGGAAALFFIML